ncbi:MAG: hypothetical protein ACKVI4_16770 [Actinomycetales bacterium]
MLLVVVVDAGLALVEVIVGIVRVRVHVIGVGWRRGTSIARRAARRRRGPARLRGTRRASTLAAAIATTLRRGGCERCAIRRRAGSLRAMSQHVSLWWPLLRVMQPLVHLRDLEPQPLDEPTQLLIRARLGCPVYGRQDGGVDAYVCLYCCRSHVASSSYPGWHLASLQASLSWLDRHCSCGHEHVVHDPFGLLNRLPSPSASKISKPRGRKKPTPAPTPNDRSAINSAGAGLSRGTAPAMTWASRRASRPTGSASRRRGERAAEGARS